MNRSACIARQAPSLHNLRAEHCGARDSAAQVLLIRLMEGLLAWQDRGRERRRLATLDERLLHDIGIDRAAAHAEASKPFWRD